VRNLIVYRSACPRTVVFNADTYPASVPVPAFGPRMVCTGCGMIGATRARIGESATTPARSRGDTKPDGNLLTPDAGSPDSSDAARHLRRTALVRHGYCRPQARRGGWGDP
jgi:hypothetical protein